MLNIEVNYSTRREPPVESLWVERLGRTIILFILKDRLTRGASDFTLRYFRRRQIRYSIFNFVISLF